MANVTIPMPGKILTISAKVGKAVKKNDVLFILEAMKMQNDMIAPADGTIKEINVHEGQSVKQGDVAMVLE